MRMHLPLHGRSHLPNGADPIPYVEAGAIWGWIRRDGGAGNMTLTNGALASTTTLIQHDTIQEESGVTCDIVSTPSRIVIDTAGLYLIELLFVDADSGSGDYGICVSRGLNATGAVWSPINAVRRIPSNSAYLNGISIENLDVGDYVTQVAGQNSGSNKTFTYLASLIVARYTGPVLSDLATIDGGSP